MAKFEKGHAKIGGIQKGFRRINALQLVTQKLGKDPIEYLIELAMEPRTDQNLRAKILTDLMPYCHPKLVAAQINVTEKKEEPKTIELSQKLAEIKTEEKPLELPYSPKPDTEPASAV